jgi:hypothetical protein
MEFTVVEPTQNWVPRANLLIYWILVTALGGAIVYPVGFWLGGAALEGLISRPLLAFLYFAGPLGGALGGAVVGFCQWFILRRGIPRIHTWVLVTILSWVIGIMVTIGLFAWLIPEGLNYFTLILPFIFGGAAVGIIQSQFFRNWVVERTWWVLAVASGWVLGWVSGLGLVGIFGQDFLSSPAISLLVIGALHGAFLGIQSGMAFILLFENSPQKIPKTTSSAL